MFYCQNVVGDANFSIDEWNKQFELCMELGIEMPRDLSPCKKQCFDCLAIVGERRRKTIEIMKRKSGKLKYER